MLKTTKFARLLAATALCGAMCSTLALPATAQDKMAPKMEGKMGGGSMMGSKMGGRTMSAEMGMKMMMGRMTASEKKTYNAMSAAEKALFKKMMMPPRRGAMGGMKMGKM